MSEEPLLNRPLGPVRAVVLGALFVGAFDITDAIVFFGLRNGASAYRIFQSIASGMLGPASFQGGLKSAALGMFLHFFIAGSIVTTYYFASRKLPILTRSPLGCGALYGVGVFVFMNQVVVRLSLARAAQFSVPWLLNMLMIHMLGVGIPSALAARAARPPAGDSATPR